MQDAGTVSPRPPPIQGPKSNNNTVHDDHLIQAKIKLAEKDSNPMPAEMPEANSAQASPSKKRKLKPDIPTAPIADLDSDISSTEEQ